MRKLAVIAIILFSVLLIIPVQSFSNEASSQAEIKVIPDDAIRLRILANSNNKADQELKRTVRDEVNAVISKWVKNIKDIDEARKLINNRIPEIQKIVGETLEREGKQQQYEVEYGKNVTFPAKLYGSYMYPPGEYEAVLITLGKGNGANWWCVLFPPLCFLDFSNGTSVASVEPLDEKKEEKLEKKEKETEVKFFLFEWFGWS
ncbi:stage II sporulation protein R [Virgibacillus kekensis]|uniref:Stage II sporulation protein R n=1 Tax=Virgibacillus kekensis TaxID=202261 RepID=A0ABV9DJG9_9BACI